MILAIRLGCGTRRTDANFDSEVLKASSWQNCSADEEIVREGDMDDRFYIVVAGNCAVERHGKPVGRLETGDCFGESSYVPGARRSATVRATSSVTLLKVGATLLEQASANCQLRFNRVFLRGLIERLQKADSGTAEIAAGPEASAQTILVFS